MEQKERESENIELRSEKGEERDRQGSSSPRQLGNGCHYDNSPRPSQLLSTRHLIPISIEANGEVIKPKEQYRCLCHTSICIF